jgi:hypothetical protein
VRGPLNELRYEYGFASNVEVSEGAERTAVAFVSDICSQ